MPRPPVGLHSGTGLACAPHTARTDLPGAHIPRPAADCLLSAAWKVPTATLGAILHLWYEHLLVARAVGHLWWRRGAGTRSREKFHKIKPTTALPKYPVSSILHSSVKLRFCKDLFKLLAVATARMFP